MLLALLWNLMAPGALQVELDNAQDQHLVSDAGFLLLDLSLAWNSQIINKNTAKILSQDTSFQHSHVYFHRNKLLLASIIGSIFK